MPPDFELSAELRLLGFSYLDGLDLHLLSCLLFSFLSRPNVLEEEAAFSAEWKPIKLEIVFRRAFPKSLKTQLL